jgi:hypothetical protein
MVGSVGTAQYFSTFLKRGPALTMDVDHSSELEVRIRPIVIARPLQNLSQISQRSPPTAATCEMTLAWEATRASSSVLRKQKQNSTVIVWGGNQPLMSCSVRTISAWRHRKPCTCTCIRWRMRMHVLWLERMGRQHWCKDFDGSDFGNRFVICTYLLWRMPNWTQDFRSSLWLA